MLTQQMPPRRRNPMGAWGLRAISALLVINGVHRHRRRSRNLVRNAGYAILKVNDRIILLLKNDIFISESKTRIHGTREQTPKNYRQLQRTTFYTRQFGRVNARELIFSVKSQDVIKILRETGPLTGWQLLERTGMEALQLWQTCRRTPGLRLECVGRRFLRLDRNVEGYARLSPSIRREFLTYTVLGLKSQAAEMKARAQSLKQEIHLISRTKFDLARESMADTAQSLSEWSTIQEQVCFIIAGDITYDMAHAVPRPEISTGRMVRGSDLDIVVIAEDSVPKEALKALDDAILRKKYLLLVQPNYQEEIDYLVKSMAKVRQQLAFDSFQHMIASKILIEGELLYGSATVFDSIKKMVKEFGVPEKLALLEKQAIENRREAEISLLKSDATQAAGAFYNLFYTHEEGDEIY